MLLPGFQVIYKPELTKEEYEESLKLGIPSNKIKAYQIFSPPEGLRKWIDYPFPFLLSDRIVVDDSALESTMWSASESIKLDTMYLSEAIDPTLKGSKEYERLRLCALCLKILRDEKGKDQVFDTYSAQDLIENKKDEFKEELFSLVRDHRYSGVAIRNTKNLMKQGILTYDKMVVSPWLYESFRTVISIFTQNRLFKKEFVPVYEKEHFRPFYQEALMAKGRFRSVNEYNEHWSDFLEALPIVAEKLQIIPLSENYNSPDSLANRIIELRGDSDIRDARNTLFKVFLDLKSGIPFNEIVDRFHMEIKKAIKQKKRIMFHMFLRNFLGGLVLGGHFGKVVMDFKKPGPMDYIMSLLVIPYITYGITESSIRDYEKLKTYWWAGFFEKLS